MADNAAVLPFSGTRIISFAQLAQGPASVQLLADLGADVVKVERPGVGSLERTYRLQNGESLLFHMLHRNQKSITVNLKSPEGIEIIRDLVRSADILVENFRPGVMKRLGLGYEELAAVNPRLIYLSASGFGPDGPYVSRPGQDLILQGLTGLAAATGTRDQLPTPTGAAVMDFHSAALNAFAMAAALVHRQKTGRGQYITTSLLQAAMHLQTEGIFESANGESHERSATGVAGPGSRAPYGIYPTADSHIVLSDVSIAQLKEVLNDPRLGEFTDDDGFTRRDEIRPIVIEKMRERTTEAWLDYLLPLGIWCGPVQTWTELLDDPQVVHNQIMFELEHPKLGKLRNLRSPIDMSEVPLSAQPRKGAPSLGEHTDQTLADLGYSPERIAKLRSAKAI